MNLEKEIENIRVVDSERNYWFVRTFGGETYSDFLENNYIGIGFNDIPYEYIYACKDGRKEDLERLWNYINVKYKFTQSTTTKWFNQILNFEHKVKNDDLVMIPNKNSETFTIGVVESNVFIKNDKRTFYHEEGYHQFPEKRRKIKWLKSITKHDIKADLSGITSTHSALSNANRFADAIEGFLTNMYIRDGMTHLVLKINQDEDINAFDLNDFLSSITYFYKEYCNEQGIEHNRDLTIKIKLQSKGKFALKAVAVVGLIGVTGIISLTQNAEFNLELQDRGNIRFNTGDGFLNSMSDFLDRKQERKIRFIKFQDSIRNLEVNSIDSIQNNTSDVITEERESNNGENNTD